MRLEGKAIKLGDDINTDFIISGRYKFAITDMRELARHIMEDIDPDFPAKITPGKSMIAAGENFGMGSSREQAPLAIKAAGITAILAKSFARIFYRNSFNIGLPLVELDTDKIKEGDLLEIDFAQGIVRNLSENSEFKIKPLPDFMQKLLREGGIVNYYKKYKTLSLE
ncbi:MAG: 3-isopropylmalate dehydratase small subunit [Candidatus Omnitrophota bacterium]|jgi:3-isopropylmalate/(R)-2-methylmalate dehydratase small subunit